MSRLGRLAGDETQEQELLESALDKSDPEPESAVSLLAKLDYEAGQFAKAGELCELGRKAQQPSMSEWLVELTKVYAQTGDKEKEVAVLRGTGPHRRRRSRPSQAANAAIVG